MPIYEYHCTSCATTYERVQPHDASRVNDCNGCGNAAERILSTFSMRSGRTSDNVPSSFAEVCEEAEGVKKNIQAELKEARRNMEQTRGVLEKFASDHL